MPKKEKSPYGRLLVKLIEQAELTQFKFYTKLNITKPYFYDIVSGKVNPPPPSTQLRIIEILNPSDKDRDQLLNEASTARQELPADIFIYLLKHPDRYSNLRKNIDYKALIEEPITIEESEDKDNAKLITT